MNGRTVSTIGILILAIVSLGLLAGCGGVTAHQPPPPIVVAVTPANASVQVGQSFGFTATVQNDPSNSGVTWSVGNANCTPTFCGTIDASGKYTAPATLPSPANGIGVVATSVADPTKSASGSVSLTLPVIVVSVSPQGVQTVLPGQSQQFTATVQNDPASKGVTWSVDSGNPFCAPFGCGTIDANGKYTAPAIVPIFVASMAITATSVADPTKVGAGFVSLPPPPTGVAASPNNVTVPLNGVQQFTGTVSPFGAISAVNWGVSGTGCTGASCGTIDANGKYTAPATAPDPSAVTATATLASDASLSGTATLFIGTNPNNAKLTGQYAFLLKGSGFEPFAIVGSSFGMVGSITADGNGNITAGVADFSSIIAFCCGTDVTLNVPLTGTYSVGSDNRGTMTLTHSCPSFCYPSQTFSFALGSFAAGVAGRGQLTELTEIDGFFVGGALASGALARQDPTAFSTAAIAGGYAFGLNNVGGQGGAAVGRFKANEGSLSAGHTDANTGHTSDVPFGGTYTVSANGRGTAVFTYPGQSASFSNFSFYVISASELFVIETDVCQTNGPTCNPQQVLTGVALQQSSGQFTLNSLNGPEVLTVSDDSVENNLSISLATFDGTGTMNGTTDAVDSNGGVIANIPVSGTYTVDADGLGRGVLTFSGDQTSRPFYLASAGKGFILAFESNSSTSYAGTLEIQSGAPFGDASVSGNFFLDVVIFPYSAWPGRGTGVVTADGAGGLSGTVDGGGGEDRMDPSFTGSYSVATNGRGTLTTTTTRNWILYIVSPSKVLFTRLFIPGDEFGMQATIRK